MTLPRFPEPRPAGSQLVVEAQALTALAAHERDQLLERLGPEGLDVDDLARWIAQLYAARRGEA
jgi:hypothetical protein